MALNPLQQFEVHELTSIDVLGQTISITNQALWVTIAVALTAIIFLAGARKKEMVPGRLQAFVEITFEFVQNLVKDTAGASALKFMPFILTLFLFLSSMNLLGMVPGSFTATSQIFVTGFMAVAVFVMVVLVGFYTHGLKFLGMFFPTGTPLWLAPLIVPLELISFFARPFTLAIRLAANMIAGHVLLKIFASFIVMLIGAFGISAGIAAGIAPLALLFAITGLEVFVALLQAYIFTVLTCVYLNDALHMH